MTATAAASVLSRRDEHAQRLGIEPDRVHLVRLQLSQLARDGTLIDIDVEGLSRFTRHLSWDELGIQAPPKGSVKFTPGQKGLIPSCYLAPLETAAQQARVALQNLSYDITGFRPYRYVPWTAWPLWTKKFADAEETFIRAKETLLADHDLVLEEMKNVFQQVAADAAKRYAAFGVKIKDGWTEELTRRQVAAIPSRGEVAALRLTWRPGMLVRDSDVEAELLDTARSQAERERLEIEQQEMRYQASREASMKEQMRKETLARYRQQLQEMALPYLEAWDQLRARVYEDARAIGESLRKNGYLRGKTVQRAAGLARTFRLLNCQNDGELDVLLRQLETLATSPIPKNGKRRREIEPIEGVLGEIARLTHASAEEVKRRAEPSRFRALEV